MIIEQIRQTNQIIKNISPGERRNLFFLGTVLFSLLFSYPILRSTTTALFLEFYGAKNSPVVWVYSVIGLVISISIYNQLQRKLSVHVLFFATAAFSFVFFTLGALLIPMGFKIMSYPLFIWKEIYIVLMIHLAFAFLNTSVKREEAKVIFGPFGAIGSVGGILGGILTSGLTYQLQTFGILITGAFTVLMGGFLFWFTDRSKTLNQIEGSEKKESPIKSVKGVGKYVLLVGLVIVLTQFVINIANFKFNILFTELVQDKTLKTRYLGNLYTGVNTLSLIIQLLVLPFLYRTVQLRTVHLFIPLTYLIVLILGFGVWGSLLIPVGLAFMFLKGSDYSLFSTSKELLYVPLKASQKYGAKYINDMVLYRFAKGLISFVLIYFQDVKVLNFAYTFS